MASGRQFCTFFLDRHFFGVEVESVQEVIRYQAMTRVPLAASVVAGLINLRGQIVMALELRRRLELPDRAADRLPMNVVVRSDDAAVSLLVDEIGDVIEVGDDAFEPPPETLRGAARELIRGAFKLRDRLLIVLDAKRIVHFDSATWPEGGARRPNRLRRPGARRPSAPHQQDQERAHMANVEHKTNGNGAASRSVIQQLPVAAFMTSASGAVVDWNERMVELTGVSPADVISSASAT